MARLGGDEFVVMLNDLDVGLAASTAQARAVADKVRASLAAPYLLKFNQSAEITQTVEHHCSASIGVNLFSHRDADEEKILRRADVAMYQSKDEGRNRVQFYSGPARG